MTLTSTYLEKQVVRISNHKMCDNRFYSTTKVLAFLEEHDVQTGVLLRLRYR